MFATVLLPAFCMEDKDTHFQRFSANSVIDKSVFDFVTKPGAPTGRRQARSHHMAINHGRLGRVGVTLRWGPTGLMLGDALTKDKGEATC